MATAKDPICGKDVDTLRARAVGIFGGVTYYFCSADCKSQFKDPRKAPRESPSPLEPETINHKKKPKKDATPAPRKDPSIELPPMKEAASRGTPSPSAQGRSPIGDEGPLPDLTPEPMVATSPSVEVELSQMRGDSRRWAVIIAVLAILVFLAAMLFLR